MQLYSPLSHQQVNEHLANLRQEAANARLRSSQPSLLSRLLNHFRRPEAESVSTQASLGNPSASKPGIRHT